MLWHLLELQCWAVFSLLLLCKTVLFDSFWQKRQKIPNQPTNQNPKMTATTTITTKNTVKNVEILKTFLGICAINFPQRLS